MTSKDKKQLEQLLYKEQAQYKRLKQFTQEGAFKNKKHGMLKNFSPRQLQTLKELFKYTIISKDTYATIQNESSKYMFLILKGTFSIVINIQDKDEIISTVQVGELIGEISALCYDKYHMANAIALEDSEVLFIRPDRFDYMIKKHKKLAALFLYNLVCMLSNRVERQLAKQE